MIRKWHSINLIPNASLYYVSEDKEPYNIIGRVLEITWLGFILDLEFKASQFTRVYSTKTRGPLWSRRRKVWYWSNY